MDWDWHSVLDTIYFLMINTDRRKILFITPLPPPVHGSSMVSQSIKESRVLNGTFEMDFVNLSTSRTMEEIDKRSWALYACKAVRFIGAYAKTLWLLATHRYDLCYLAITCHGVGFLKDAPFVLLCKLFGRKVVIHQHNKGMAKDADRPIYRWLLPMVYRNTKVILLSWRLYADIQKVVKREQVMICHNGIPDTNSTETSVERHNDIPHILFLSNLIVSKGVLVLLDALKILKEKGWKFICDFVGGETKELDGRRFAHEIETRGLDGIAVYHGRKYGKDKETFLRMADMLVFPTYYFNECFPLVILEAMMYGLPVISSDEGGIRDEVSDGINGFVVEPQDSTVLADTIGQLLDGKEIRNRMGTEGRLIFQKRFTMKCFENNIKRLLLNCIEVNDK